MAFNFNWSPLTADAGFYERARDLLTTALNKSPKPPIIVDDIFVTEFNLGSVPPDLEILEIGDLAEDRFRGIFKMCYSGDAFLTLATRVQVRLFQHFLSYAPSHHIRTFAFTFSLPTIRRDSYCAVRSAAHGYPRNHWTSATNFCQHPIPDDMAPLWLVLRTWDMGLLMMTGIMTIARIKGAASAQSSGKLKTGDTLHV